ncbi:MAG: hypothetical protein ACOX7J_07520 [Bacillota bacterium]|jgi:hypothetical protein
MENLIFENRYQTTRELLEIYTKEILAKRFQKQFWILVIIFALLTIPGIVTQDYIIAVLAAAGFVVTLALTVFFPRLMFRQMEKIQHKIHNGKKPNTVVEFGDSIHLQEGKCEIALEYPQITEIYFLSQIYVLMFEKSNGIMLKNDAFVKGTAEDFRIFITEHCPQARIFKRGN